MKISELKESIFVSKSEASERALKLAQGLSKDKRLSRGESIEKLYARSLKGVICEMAIAKKIEGQFNPNEFDYTNRSSYAWDILSPEGYRIEVKRQRTNWLTLRPEVKNTLITNIAERHVDYIITCEHKDANSDFYIVQPKFLIKAHSFAQFVIKSKYGDNFIYKHGHAMRNRECFRLNS